MLETLRQDVKFAVRTLVKTPTFTAAVIITIALGVGATTAIFTVVDGIVLRPLPFPDSERVVMLCEPNRRIGDWCGASPSNVADWLTMGDALESAGVARNEPIIAQLGGEAFGVRGGIATPGFFEVLRLQPSLGRLFEGRDMDRGANHVALVSQGFWQRRLASDPSIVGRSITLDGEGFVIVGVLPPDAFIPRVDGIEVWKPLTASFDNVDNRGWRGFTAIGRVADGVTMAQLDTELQTLRAQLAQAYPEDNDGWGVRAVGLRGQLVGDVSRTLWVFLGAVGFVLLIACANVASLLLVRATGRSTEFAVRASLGAGGRRLAQQLFTESIVLAGIGGALGLVLAFWATRGFLAMAPGSIPRLDEVAIDGRVALFAFLLSAATAVIFGFAPARRASRPDLNGTLKGIRQVNAGDARLRSAFVVVELALALMLLVGAGLLTRSFGQLLAWDPGFERSGVVLSWMLPPSSVYPTGDEVVAVMERARDAAAAVPGVEHAALASAGPLFGGEETGGLVIDGRPPLAEGEAPPVQWFDISPEYFETLGLPVVSGRGLTEADSAGAAPVALVNETLARRFFPNESPLGRRVTVREHTAEIVGVVADAASYRADRPTSPQIYWPIRQYRRFAAYLVMRAPASLEGLEKSVRAGIAGVEPLIQLNAFTRLDDYFDRTLVDPRFNMALVAVFALVAVALAAVGVFGVVAFTVASRTREIGVRIALGATPGVIVSEVVGRGMTLAGIGMAFGLAGALVVGRFLESLLYGLPPTDLLSLGGAVAGFALVALVASWVPARRAAKIDPIAALRTE